MPEYVQQLNKWSIDNKGNEKIAYFTPNCQSSSYSPSPHWIPAGNSSFSLGLGSFKEVDQGSGSVYKIKSFGPDFESEYFKKSCSKNVALLKNDYLSSSQMLIAEFQNLFRQVDALGPIQQEVSFRLENAKNDFIDKLRSLPTEC